MGESIDALDVVMGMDGAVAVAVVDHTSGLVLARREKIPFDMELAAAVSTEVVKAQLRAIEHLGLGEKIEDILVTLTHQYHLVRVSDREGMTGLFHYVVLDRSRANLALARRALAILDTTFSLQSAMATSGGLS